MPKKKDSDGTRGGGGYASASNRGGGGGGARGGYAGYGRGTGGRVWGMKKPAAAVDPDPAVVPDDDDDEDGAEGTNGINGGDGVDDDVENEDTIEAADGDTDKEDETYQPAPQHQQPPPKSMFSNSYSGSANPNPPPPRSSSTRLSPTHSSSGSGSGSLGGSFSSPSGSFRSSGHYHNSRTSVDRSPPDDETGGASGGPQSGYHANGDRDRRMSGVAPRGKVPKLSTRYSQGDCILLSSDGVLFKVLRQVIWKHAPRLESESAQARQMVEQLAGLPQNILPVSEKSPVVEIILGFAYHRAYLASRQAQGSRAPGKSRDQTREMGLCEKTFEELVAACELAKTFEMAESVIESLKAELMSRNPKTPIRCLQLYRLADRLRDVDFAKVTSRLTLGTNLTTLKPFGRLTIAQIDKPATPAASGPGAFSTPAAKPPPKGGKNNKKNNAAAEASAAEADEENDKQDEEKGDDAAAEEEEEGTGVESAKDYMASLSPQACGALFFLHTYAHTRSLEILNTPLSSVPIGDPETNTHTDCPSRKALELFWIKTSRMMLINSGSSFDPRKVVRDPNFQPEGVSCVNCYRCLLNTVEQMEQAWREVPNEVDLIWE